MSIILNIETSTDCCSVALSDEGAILEERIEREGMNHARLAAPFADECLDWLKRQEKKADAVAVSIGPGSYTGLRIGMSLAKGLCMGMGVPLIGVPTLQILAVKAMFSRFDFQGDELLIPMLDARRMEVYTATYGFALDEIQPVRPLILEPDSFAEMSATGRRLVFIGNGAEKARGALQVPDDTLFLPEIYPDARGMLALSERAFRQNDFLDVAYSVPFYLKEFQATVPKRPF
ncbi:MAG: tRNA (adenosine(37)-N6)-threonylcarbamoyltransferase complex dimerization subunit type 1 TsaB [Muribaculaceae bacterium]|nr:tRNA (adenosine(37)-N6)-threonylcarbamoyltransferase complex dimerization subunit type 1 TsaB [Muribaculaceae bacterium]